VFGAAHGVPESPPSTGPASDIVPPSTTEDEPPLLGREVPPPELAMAPVPMLPPVATAPPVEV
jgi:hypothetical protein